MVTSYAKTVIMVTQYAKRLSHPDAMSPTGRDTEEVKR
jgi:hypothetical protein